jgi:hypothetical protein
MGFLRRAKTRAVGALGSGERQQCARKNQQDLKCLAHRNEPIV